jgi:hypothetical protein
MMNKNDMDEIRHMTLRDWFAGQAIQNAYLLYDDAYERTVSDETYAEAATNAYRIADAMLAARDRNQGAAIAKAEGRAEG